MAKRTTKLNIENKRGDMVDLTTPLTKRQIQGSRHKDHRLIHFLDRMAALMDTDFEFIDVDFKFNFKSGKLTVTGQASETLLNNN